MPLDPECVELVEAMNLIPGIHTVESCCGHGKAPFRIWFEADELKNLPDLLYWFDGCHCGFYGWKTYVKTDCAFSPVMFKVEGPAGQQGYDEAKAIAKLLSEHAILCCSSSSSAAAENTEFIPPRG